MLLIYNFGVDSKILSQFFIFQNNKNEEITSNLISWDEIITYEYEKYKVFRKSQYSVWINEKNRKFIIEIEKTNSNNFINAFLKIQPKNDFEKILKKIAYKLIIKLL
jgi:hypothetical protein